MKFLILGHIILKKLMIILVHFAGNDKVKAIQKFKLDFGFNDTSLVPIKYEDIANKIKEGLLK